MKRAAPSAPAAGAAADAARTASGGASSSGKGKGAGKRAGKRQKTRRGPDARPEWVRRGVAVRMDGARVAVDALGLSAPVVRCLRERAGVSSFFPIQAAVVPVVRRARLVSDVLVSAPTGSGKTLAYVVPIVDALRERVVPRLRALVVVPARDLALQVFGVLQQFCPALGLRAALALGQRSFADEQAALMGASDARSLATRAPRGECGVDVLVATPGRLVEHLHNTPGFSLRHLQFLVIDEADRLLAQHYYGWARLVLASAAEGRGGSGGGSQYGTDVPLQKLLLSATMTQNPQKLASLALRNPLFFSAAAARGGGGGGDDDKEGEEEKEGVGRYTVPHGLRESMVVCAGDLKPLYAYYLVRLFQQEQEAEDDEQEEEEKEEGEGKSKQVLVFASSVEATQRLSRLLRIMLPRETSVVEFSSSLSQQERSRAVQRFRARRTGVMVCSDAMSRGMDIEGVGTVINYDVPTHAQTYVHRVGRTARAGAGGRAVTLVEAGQQRLFRRVRGGVNAFQVRALKGAAGEADIKKAHLRDYERALKQLEREVLESK